MIVKNCLCHFKILNWKAICFLFAVICSDGCLCSIIEVIPSSKTMACKVLGKFNMLNLFKTVLFPSYSVSKKTHCLCGFENPVSHHHMRPTCHWLALRFLSHKTHFLDNYVCVRVFFSVWERGRDRDRKEKLWNFRGCMQMSKEVFK